MCQSLFFNKVAGLRTATSLKKETLAQVFSCEFCEISKCTFFTEHLSATASGLIKEQFDISIFWIVFTIAAVLIKKKFIFITNLFL